MSSHFHVISRYFHLNSFTLYKNSKYGFLPEIGQKISDNVILFQSIPKDEKNKQQLLKSMQSQENTYNNWQTMQNLRTP